MTAVAMPKNCTHLALIEALAHSDAFAPSEEALVFQVPPDCFIYASAMAWLTAWGTAQSRPLRFVGHDDTLRYLSRMDVLNHLGVTYEETFQRHEENDRFLPVQSIQDEESVFDTVNALCDMILGHFDNARSFLPAFEWAICELIDNILLHSQTPVPGTVCAQFYPKRQYIDIGICDMGQGIKASLDKAYPLIWSHGDAITKALQRGVSRDQTIGQGNGLAGTLEILTQNQGDWQFWTGDVTYKLEKGQNKGFSKHTGVPGTGMYLRMYTWKPVNLRDTFIGERSFDFLQMRGNQIESAGGLKIQTECVHTGGRQPAQTLRRRILALLPELEDPLTLDFSGIESSSSSFLDELLGRLALELGASHFHNRIRISHLSPLLQDMANVVIHQRLNGISEEVTEDEA